MNILEWIRKLRQKQDSAAVSRAESMATETPEEQRITSGDIEAEAADVRAARVAGQTPSEADRLGNDD